MRNGAIDDIYVAMIHQYAVKNIRQSIIFGAAGRITTVSPKVKRGTRPCAFDRPSVTNTTTTTTAELGQTITPRGIGSR